MFKSSNDGDAFSNSESEVSSQQDQNESNPDDQSHHQQPYHSSPEQFLHMKEAELLQMKQNILVELTNPILEFMKLLILYDFIQKYTPTRKWNELFRLSLPETSNLQEEIILFIFESIHQHPLISYNNNNNNNNNPNNNGNNSSNSNSNVTNTNAASSNNNSNGSSVADLISLEISMNFLRNISYFLEQLLEKMKLSLKFSSKMIQILYSLNYHCTIELRSRLKDTVLPEVRKSFIIRCLIDVGQDVYLRIDILNEILTSLQAFLTLNESKLITDSQIIILILGMFIEVIEDLEANQSTSSHHVSHHHHHHHHHHHDSHILHPYHEHESPKQNSQQVLTTLLTIMHSCVVASSECKKTTLKICEGLVYDPQNILVKNFVNNSVASNYENVKGPGGGDYHSPLPSAPTQPSSSGGLWWGSWGSSSSSQVIKPTAVNLDPDTIHIERKQSESSVSSSDLEAGKVPSVTVASSLRPSISSSSGGNSSSSSTALYGAMEPKDGISFIKWFLSHERR
jgi:hypothetical protein